MVGLKQDNKELPMFGATVFDSLEVGNYHRLCHTFRDPVGKSRIWRTTTIFGRRAFSVGEGIIGMLL